MKFVPAGTAGVLFSVYDTRVQDFHAFVDATQYDATAGCISLDPDGWKQRGDNWKSPGFKQGPNFPVCGVSWTDAEAFCRWLTIKERKEGIIRQGQSYHLPTDAEWSAAVGTSLYPWGDTWPPPAQGGGNYAGQIDGLAQFIDGYYDGYARTSPGGTHNSNYYGLYDMSGNLRQWCEDWYRKEMNRAETISAFPYLANDSGGQAVRVVRGGSWCDSNPVYLRSDTRDWQTPDYRDVVYGFRCVIVVSPSTSTSQ